MKSIENQSMTVGTLAKLVVAVVVIVGWSLTCYAWVSRIDAKVELLRQEQAMSHTVIDQRLAQLSDDAKASQRVQQDLTIAVNRVATLLETMQKRTMVPADRTTGE